MNNSIILCAIAKNESPYLVEWITYHKYIVGFDDIVIYDNDSQDCSVEMLEKLSDLGLCKFHHWNRVFNKQPQKTAYEHCINEYKNDFEWVCFLDLDEFLVLKGYQSINDCLEYFNPLCDCIVANWRMFNSGGQTDFSSGLVTERFTQCTIPQHSFNGVAKSISRISKIKRVDEHIPLMAEGSKIYHIDSRELILKSPGGKRRFPSRQISHENAQINHYYCKSNVEYKAKKVRGRVSAYGHSPEVRLKTPDFDACGALNNKDVNLDIQVYLEPLKAFVAATYDSLGGKQQYETRFKDFIESEAKRYDALMLN